MIENNSTTNVSQFQSLSSLPLRDGVYCFSPDFLEAFPVIPPMALHGDNELDASDADSGVNTTRIISPNQKTDFEGNSSAKTRRHPLDETVELPEPPFLFKDDFLPYQTENGRQDLKKLLESWNCVEFYNLFMQQQLYVQLLESAPFENIKDLVDSTYCSLGFKLHFYDSFQKWQAGLRSLSSSSQLISDEPSTPPVQQSESSHPTNINTDNTENVLIRIFRSSPQKASKVQEYFKEHHFLNVLMRDKLMKIIARYFVTNKMTFSSKTCRIISQHVVEAFPSEKESNFIYYHDGKKRWDGPLYKRFFYEKSAFERKTTDDKHEKSKMPTASSTSSCRVSKKSKVKSNDTDESQKG